MLFRNTFASFSIVILKRYAGHSKWANIKHTKAITDSERAKLFLRLCQRMKVAIHEGGSSDPSANIQLAQAIQVAKKQSMPAASIENCIKSFKKDKSEMKSAWFEIKGPGGCFLIISALTDNHRRTRDTIAPILKKFHVLFIDGAAKKFFQKKGEVHVTLPPDLKNIDDVIIEHAIECGAEEVLPSEAENEVYIFICEPENLFKVSDKLQGLKYTIKSADINFIANEKVELSDEDVERMSKLFDKLEEHPDIVKIYDNIS